MDNPTFETSRVDLAVQLQQVGLDGRSRLVARLTVTRRPATPWGSHDSFPGDFFFDSTMISTYQAMTAVVWRPFRSASLECPNDFVK